MLVSKPEAPRSSQPLATPRLRRRYWTLLTTLLALSALFAFGLLAWDNPMPVGTEGFWMEHAVDALDADQDRADADK